MAMINKQVLEFIDEELKEAFSLFDQKGNGIISTKVQSQRYLGFRDFDEILGALYYIRNSKTYM
jgi:Ca2+-binding EF-hand superfamily protein